HKGSPYYFWGMTALLGGDLDKGYCLMHQSVEEDIRTRPSTYRDFPGFLLVSLNYERLEQTFRSWVLAQADLLDRCIKDYSARHGRTFALLDFRRRLLDSGVTGRPLWRNQVVV